MSYWKIEYFCFADMNGVVTDDAPEGTEKRFYGHTKEYDDFIEADSCEEAEEKFNEWASNQMESDLDGSLYDIVSEQEANGADLENWTTEVDSIDEVDD